MPIDTMNDGRQRSQMKARTNEETNKEYEPTIHHATYSILSLI